MTNLVMLHLNKAAEAAALTLMILILVIYLEIYLDLVAMFSAIVPDKEAMALR
jgi:hypothetical protein